MKTKKKSGKTLRKSGKSQGKIREFDGIKKVGTLLGFLGFQEIAIDLISIPSLDPEKINIFPVGEFIIRIIKV